MSDATWCASPRATRRPQPDVPSLLVVDDEPLVRRAYVRLLTPEGYHVTTAPSGDAALAELALYAFDLVLLDNQMPGLSGIETAAEIRKLYPNTPVMLMSARCPADLPADLPFIDKPCELDQLCAAIVALIGEP